MSRSDTHALDDRCTLVRALDSGGPPLDVLVRMRPLRLCFEASVRVAAVDVVPREEWLSDPGSTRECAISVPPLLRGASRRRLSTFLAGRYCAREALRGAEMASTGRVGMRDDGAPIWPRGMVGSIAHTDRCALSAVAASTEVRGLGIDLEPMLTAVEADQIAPEVAPELSALTAADDCDVSGATLVTIAFSLKESAYKCLAPLTGVFFTFGDVQIVHLDPCAGRARVRLARHIDAEFSAGTNLTASFAVDGDVVVTMVQLAAFAQVARGRGASPAPRATEGVAARLAALY